jgi:hypothetical protein
VVYIHSLRNCRHFGYDCINTVHARNRCGVDYAGAFWFRPHSLFSFKIEKERTDHREPKASEGGVRNFFSGLNPFCCCRRLDYLSCIETVSSDEKADFILVLGCGIFPDGSLTQTLQNRLDAALEYYNQHPDAVFVVSGGQGPKEPVPEATAMKNYLMSKGIPEEKILTESKSTSTNENMKFSKQIIEERFGQIDAKTVIATVIFTCFARKCWRSTTDLRPTEYPGKRLGIFDRTVIYENSWRLSNP